MRNLHLDPAWKAEDLGVAIPDNPHAISVCLPTWDSIVGYEEGLEKVTSKMVCGYPRFFKHPAINRLFSEAKQLLCQDGESTVLFPNIEAAQRAQRFVEKRHPIAVRISSYGPYQALILPEDQFSVAMEYWRYTGEIISSRSASAHFNDEHSIESHSEKLRQQIAQYSPVQADQHFFYENGMSAAYAALRAVLEISPGKKTLQLEFPYVDALKIQQNFGTGVVYLNECEDEPFTEALSRIKQGEFAAVFCETPSNPLLRSIDLELVSKACREGGTILVVDDTISSCYNVDITPFADIITTSLTKWISGVGDVMGGLVRVCPQSPLKNELDQFFNQDNPTGSKIYHTDEAVLLNNSKGFNERMKLVNDNGLKICQLLQEHPAVDSVFYPSTQTADLYEKVKKSNGGYGGLISFTLKSPKKAPAVFDALAVSKGPSLGTDFTLASPYTLLAHYDELEWVENCGVSPSLIRVSIGTEPIEQLRSAFEVALKKA